jgi:hypothetical protein
MSNSDEPVKRGRGRPPGAMSRMAKEARERAQATGELPHEFLLRVARGEVITVKSLDKETGEIVETSAEIPDLHTRIDAAKAAAPYFAPKISTVEVMTGVSDNELDSLIAQLATQAGISAGIDREGEEGEEEEGTESGTVRRRVRVHDSAAKYH